MRFKLFFCVLVVVLAAVLGAVLSVPKAYAVETTRYIETSGVRYPKAFQKAYERLDLTEEQANTWGIVEIFPDNSENPSYIIYLMIPWYNTISNITFTEVNNSTDFVNFYLSSFPDNAGAVSLVVTNYKGELNQMDVTVASPVAGISGYHPRYNFVLPATTSTYPLVYEYFKPLRPGSSDLITPTESTVDSISNAGLLAELYDITFTPTKIMPSNVSFPLLNKALAVAPVAVVDDSGYNLISLQVPQLGYYTDVVVFGHYDFTPRDVSKYSFDKLTLSFGVDKLNENDEEFTGDVSNSDFSCTFAGWDLPEATMTVNSFSFLYNTKTQKYRNVELAAFDFSTTTAGSYPAGQFNTIGSINIKSAGSFCYNFTFENVNDVQNQRPLTPEELDDLSDSGNDRSQRTIQEFGYIPRDFTANTVDVDFGDWQPDQYDFSAANGLLSILLNDFVVDIILACVSVGIVGLILYGKQ